MAYIAPTQRPQPCEWPTLVVLSATTGILMADMGQMHEFIDYMVQDKTATLGMAVAADMSKPHVEAQYPILAELDDPPPIVMDSGERMSDGAWFSLLYSWLEESGVPDTLSLMPIPEGQRSPSQGDWSSFFGGSR